MGNVDEQLRIHIRSVLNTAPEDTVNGIIHALRHAGLESLSELQFVQEEDLILVLKPIQRRKLVKAWSELSANGNSLSGIGAASVSSCSLPSQNTSLTTNSVFIESPYSPSCSNSDSLSGIEAASVSSFTSSSQNTSVTTNSVFIESPSFSSYIPPLPSKTSSNSTLQICKWTATKCLVLLQIYTKFKKELSACPDVDKLKIWRKIALGVQQTCSLNCNEFQCLNKINELRREYQTVKTQNEANEETAIFLNAAENAFEASEDSVTSETGKSDRRKQLKLLRIYAKHKRGLLDPAVEKQIVWKKIANEFKKMSSVDYDELLGSNLSDECEQEKNDDVKNRGKDLFFDIVRKSFEATENPNHSSCMDDKVEAVVEKYKPSHLMNLKNVQNRLNTDQPNCGDDKVQEIADETIPLRFRNMTYVPPRFRSVENEQNGPAMFSKAVASKQPLCKRLTSCMKNKQYRLKLLQVYGKYKAEFYSPDVDEEKVWEKILTELRERHLYDSDKSLCQFELDQMKCNYEDVKKKQSNSKPYFFEEAQKVFENTEDLGTSCYDVSKVENNGKCISPHFRSTETEQNGPVMSAKTVDRRNILKVSNLPKDVKISDLQELFEPFGTIAFLYKIKSVSDESKCSAFITFLKQEDAARAVASVDGMQFNKITLKVEWAASSQTNEISKV